MLKTKQKQVGDRGYTYTVRQFGARDGSRVLMRIMKTIGKPIGDAISGGSSVDNVVVGKIISGLAEAINDEDFDYLCDQFSAHTEVQGGNQDAWRQYPNRVPLSTQGVFDLHFAGEYSELIAWLMFCVEVNYGDFLPAMSGVRLSGVLQGLGNEVQRRSESTSQSTSEENGPSGVSSAVSGSPSA